MNLITKYPNITVACVVPKDNKFLFVRENSDGAIVYNQPAGHLKQNETLIEAAKRETLEETAWQVEITHFLEIYQYASISDDVCYVEHSFVAEPKMYKKDVKLDADITGTYWLTIDEAAKLSDEMRSPLVLKTLTDYMAGNLYSLKILHPELESSSRLSDE